MNVLKWLGVTVAALGVAYCVQPTKRIIQQAPPAPTCGALQVGDTTTEACEGGERVMVCTTAGLKEVSSSCSGDTPPPDPGFLTFDALEQLVLDDLSNLDKDERDDYVYIVTAHRANAGEPTVLYDRAVSKALNSISTENALANAEEVAPGLFRVELEDYGLDAAEWTKIEDADLLNIESFTGRGDLLKLLTGKRKPIMHVEAFVDTIMRNSTVYYDLTGTPATFPELVAQLGVDYAADLADFDAIQGAFVGSPLSPHNRMVSRHESDDGALWCTYDTGPTDEPQENYFEFPLLGDSGGVRNAKFTAGECIYDRPNGTHGYVLFAAQDTVVGDVFVRSDLFARQDVAPVNVVLDYRASQLGLSAEIRNAISCFACHKQGMIPFQDQIRDHVLANGSEFDADKDIILAVYEGNQAWQNLFRKDNDLYTKVMSDLGVDVTNGEPITHCNDNYLTSWDLERVAAFLFLRPEEFKTLIDQSATARAQVGQLARGGRITFDQVLQSLPIVIQELNLFRDPIQ